LKHFDDVISLLLEETAS